MGILPDVRTLQALPYGLFPELGHYPRLCGSGVQPHRLRLLVCVSPILPSVHTKSLCTQPSFTPKRFRFLEHHSSFCWAAFTSAGTPYWNISLLFHETEV
jgi:hypothetical protein